MKKYMLIFVLFVSVTVAAQEFKGIAVYESLSVNKEEDIKIEGADPATEAMMREYLASMKLTYTLAFNKYESVYQREVKLDPMARNGSVSNDSDIRYTDLRDKIVLEERDIFGKEFIVKDSVRKWEWKLENEAKQIGNYTCYKATHTFSMQPAEDKEEKSIDLLSKIPPNDIVITAWYAPELPVSHGPGIYWGLPGLILEVNDGRTIMLCSKLTINPKEKLEVKAPDKGKIVTHGEYMEILKKKSDERRDSEPDLRGKNVIKGTISRG